jgi:hypothetical protein
MSGQRSKIASRSGRAQGVQQQKGKKFGAMEPLQNGGSALNVCNNLPSGFSPEVP